MADPLSIAVGVVGVLSFSVQVAQTSRKLSGLLKSIKDLPEELECMINELDILSIALEQHDGALEAGKRAAQQLRKLLKLLQHLLDDSQTYIRRSKHKFSWKAIKVTMRKDEINRLYERMVSCRNLLHTVNRIAFHESQKFQMNAMQQSQSKDSENIALILDLVSKRTDHARQDETQLTTQRQTKFPDTGIIDRPAAIPKHRRYGDSWDFIACYWFFIGCIYFYQTSSKNRKVTDDDSSNDCNVVQNSSPWKINFELLHG